jgi:DNA-binding NarL/FixJ family response regulator
MLVDDHAIMRDGIKAILQSSAGFTVTGEAGCGDDCLRLCAESKPDIVVMDIGLPGPDGIEVTAELRRRHPATKVLIHSMHDDGHSVFRAIQAGARGFLLKKVTGSGDLIRAVQTVASDGFYLGTGVAGSLYGQLQAGGFEDPADSPPAEQPSARERQLPLLIAEGRIPNDRAAMPFHSAPPVPGCPKPPMSEPEVRDVTSLIQLALACGLVNRSKLAPGTPGHRESLPPSRIRNLQR